MDAAPDRELRAELKKGADPRRLDQILTEKAA